MSKIVIRVFFSKLASHLVVEFRIEVCSGRVVTRQIFGRLGSGPGAYQRWPEVDASIVLRFGVNTWNMDGYTTWHQFGMPQVMKHKKTSVQSRCAVVFSNGVLRSPSLFYLWSSRVNQQLSVVEVPEGAPCCTRKPFKIPRQETAGRNGK